jgi:DNA-binding NtrC family response regulator
MGWADDSGGKETGADFLETHWESCFSGNRRARVFTAVHKRAVTKHQRKRSLFGHAFAFLGQKSDKNQN